MASGNDQASFAINLSGNAGDVARDMGGGLEQLRAKIDASQSSIKGMRAAFQNLRGASDEVKAAKEGLKAKLDAERAAISQNTLEMLKHQSAQKAALTDSQKTALEKAKLIEKLKDETAKQKRLTDARKALPENQMAAKQKALSAAITAGGGPVAGLVGKLSSLKEALGESGAGGGTALLALGITGLVAAAAALAAGIAGLAYKFAQFALGGANAARSMGLLRQAAMGGNAQWGKNAGEQVDLLASKLPTAKSEINALGNELAKQGVSGQTWVDTMNAVAQANAAGMDGAKIKEFITRGKELQNFRLDPREMMGTGATFNDVAAQLATSMKIGVNDAKQALFEGRVKLADGAAAMHAAIEKNLGGINLKQMLSFETLSTKLGEAFESMTTGINLEPMLNAIKDVLHVFDQTTVSGQALKQIVTLFGNDMSGAVGHSGPLVKRFIYGMIIGAQQATIAYLQLRNEVQKVFGTDTLTSANAFSIAMGAGRGAVLGIELSLKAVLMTMQAIKGLNSAGNAIGDFYKSIWTEMKALDAGLLLGFRNLGTNMIDGLVTGITSGFEKVKTTVTNLGDVAKNALKSALNIHSPSKVFAEYGQNTSAGYAQGVDKGSADAQRAVNSMVSVPSASSGSGASGGSFSFQFTINAGGGDEQKMAAALKSESTLEQITRAVMAALQSGADPVPS